jgi:superfamily II DNA or RNA helicase
MNEIAELAKDVKTVHGETDEQALLKKRNYSLHAVTTAERRAIYSSMESGETRKIMSTYIYKQGVNFPQLQVVINAGGGGSEIVAKQIPGRESRHTGDSKPCSYLVDFTHPWDVEKTKSGKTRPGPVARDDRAREKSYTQLGFKQIWIKPEELDQLPFLQADNAAAEEAHVRLSGELRL